MAIGLTIVELSPCICCFEVKWHLCGNVRHIGGHAEEFVVLNTSAYQLNLSDLTIGESPKGKMKPSHHVPILLYYHCPESMSISHTSRNSNSTLPIPFVVAWTRPCKGRTPTPPCIEICLFNSILLVAEVPVWHKDGQDKRDDAQHGRKYQHDLHRIAVGY